MTLAEWLKDGPGDKKRRGLVIQIMAERWLSANVLGTSHPWRKPEIAAKMVDDEIRRRGHWPADHLTALMPELQRASQTARECRWIPRCVRETRGLDVEQWFQAHGDDD